MVTYSVKADKHDFLPNDQPIATLKTKCNWKFQMDPSMYYRRSDPSYPYGSYNGWNKLGGGFTEAYTANNKRSAMLAWFPDETVENRWTIAGYTNDRKKGFKAEELLNVGLGLYEGQTILVSGYVVFKIRPEGSAEDYKFLRMPMDTKIPWYSPFRFVKLYRGIGPYFGGQHPAFKPMNFLAHFEYY